MPNTVFSSSVSGSNCSVLFKIFILTCGFDFVLSSENAIYFLSDSCVKYITEDIYVIGIAEGKKEALELVRDIIDEVYSNTGGFNISQYLRFGCKR